MDEEILRGVSRKRIQLRIWPSVLCHRQAVSVPAWGGWGEAGRVCGQAWEGESPRGQQPQGMHIADGSFLEY